MRLYRPKTRPQYSPTLPAAPHSIVCSTVALVITSTGPVRQWRGGRTHSARTPRPKRALPFHPPRLRPSERTRTKGELGRANLCDGTVGRTFAFLESRFFLKNATKKVDKPFNIVG